MDCFTKDLEKYINIKIKANEFVYEKLSNTLKLLDNVIIEDLNKNATLFSSKAIYYKDKEIFVSESNSKFVNNEIKLFHLTLSEIVEARACTGQVSFL